MESSNNIKKSFSDSFTLIYLRLHSSIFFYIPLDSSSDSSTFVYISLDSSGVLFLLVYTHIHSSTFIYTRLHSWLVCVFREDPPRIYDRNKGSELIKQKQLYEERLKEIKDLKIEILEAMIGNKNTEEEIEQ